MLAHLLLAAPAPLGIALLNERTGVILPTNAHLRAVESPLAVKNVRAIELDLRRVDIPDHVLVHLRVVVHQRHCVR